MATEIEARIESLDDKQACSVAHRLAEVAFKNHPPPSFEEIADSFDALGKSGGLNLNLSSQEGWAKVTAKEAEAGEVARAVLGAWASDPGLAPAVDQAITQFKTAKQDLGIISMGVAVGLMYLLTSTKFKISLGSFQFEKQGLTSQQQADIVKAMAGPFLKALSGPGGS